MIISKIHNKTLTSCILFTDICTGDFFNTHDFMNYWVKVMFCMLVNLLIRNKNNLRNLLSNQSEINQSLATCEWFYRAEFLHACRQFLYIIYNAPVALWLKLTHTRSRLILVKLRYAIHIARSRVVYFFTMFVCMYVCMYLSISTKFMVTNHLRSENARKLRFSPKCRSQHPP